MKTGDKVIYNSLTYKTEYNGLECKIVCDDKESCFPYDYSIQLHDEIFAANECELSVPIRVDLFNAIPREYYRKSRKYFS